MNHLRFAFHFALRFILRKFNYLYLFIYRRDDISKYIKYRRDNILFIYLLACLFACTIVQKKKKNYDV